MSKSESDKGTIYLLDDINISRKKIMSAVTDSDCEIKYDPVNKPGVSNLLVIESSLSGVSIEELEKKYAVSNYGEFKKCVADVVCNFLEELQAKVREIQSSGIIDKILEDGAMKASYVARKKLSKVYRKMGIN